MINIASEPLLQYSASEISYTVSGGVLNSAQSNPLVHWTHAIGSHIQAR